MSLFKNIGLLTLGQSLNLVVNLLFLPYMSRTLDYESYGTYGQAVLIISTLTTILTMGLPQILNIFLADTQKDQSETLKANMFLSLSLGLIGVFLIVILHVPLVHFFKNEALLQPLLIYSISILFSVPYNSFITYLVFQNKVKQNVMVSVSTNLLKVLLVILIVRYTQSVSLVMIVLVFIAALQFFIIGYLCRKVLKAKLREEFVKIQLVKAVPLGMTTVMGVVILYTDSFMVSNMLGVKEYAIFRNGAMEVPFLSSIYGAISTIVLPELAKLWQEKKVDEVVALKGKIILNSAIVVYPFLALFLFYAQSFIVWYFGEAYVGSAVIFAIYNLLLIIRINDYYDVLIISGNSNKILKANVVIAFVNVLLTIVLIHYYGAKGAAAGIVISVFLLMIYLLYETNKVIHSKIWSYLNFRKTSCVLLLSLVLAFVFCYLLPHLFDLSTIVKIFLALVYFLVFYGMVWKLGFVDEKIANFIKLRLGFK